MLIVQKMSKRFLGLNPYRSFPLLPISLSPSNSHLHPFISHKISLLSLPTIQFKFFVNTTSNLSPEPLQGLVDPEAFPTSSSHVDSFISEDLSFLRDSFLGPADSSPVKSGKFSNDAVLISNVVRESNNVFEFKTQKCLRKFRDKLNESLVIDVLKLVKNPKIGVNFFIWAGQQVGYTHSKAVYDVLLDIMGCDKNDRIPEHFLLEIRDDDREVLGKMLNLLIQKCCHSGMWNVALEELGRMKDFGFKPSRLTYNALLRVFLEADKLDTARLLHREMSNAGFRMEVSTMSCFAYALCKAGKWREALDLIDKEGFVPDTKLYTTMISGLCEASLFDEAMGFLNKMRCSSSLPNVLTYRILLCGCLKKRQLGRCKRILSMMMAEGCYPSRKIFNSLVHAYCTSGDYSYAYNLLKKMADCGCPPGYLVYNILIGGICSRDELPTSVELQLSEKVYDEMLNLGLVLNKINVSNFSRCLCEAGKFDKAFNIINEMMSKGFLPDCSTYSKVIEFLCNSSLLQKAVLLFEEMKRFGIVQDVYTYTVLIDGFCKAGLIAQAHVSGSMKWWHMVVLLMW